MFRRAALGLLFAVLALPARAASYGDLWWNPNESGWGVQVVQSGSFQFVTFFIYGADGKPTWYTAELNEDASGASYSGELYFNTGTYFAAPWDPLKVTNVAVGTASFTPLDAYHATLSYTVIGVGTVTKSIVRQTLLPQALAGSYSGSLTGKVTGCTDPANNKSPVRGRFTLAVQQVADTSATLTFTFVDTTYAGTVCTISGALAHYGSLYEMVGAQYSCTGQGITPGMTTARVDRLHSTQQGIEGTWTAVVNGCTQAIKFAAVDN